MLSRATTFVDNPRRFPRVPVRLRIVVSARGQGFEAETEDLGPGGCLVRLPRPLVQGLQVRVALGAASIPETLSVIGHVAWARSADLMRAGVAFDLKQPGAVRPQAWFQKLIAADPGMAARVSRAPERIGLDAPLYLLPPPRRILDLLPEEAALLRRLENGVTPRELLDGRPEQVAVATRTLFSLFEKRALTLALGQSAPAWQWREALSRLEEEGTIEPVVLEDLGAVVAPLDPPIRRTAPTARPSRPPPLLRREALGPERPPAQPPPKRPDAPALTPAPAFTPPPLRTPPPPLSTSPASAPPLRPAARAPEEPTATPAPLVSKVADRTPGVGRGRTALAQQCLDMARAAAEGGDFHTAIGLLRRGLQIAPRDPEIADLLGRYAFRGRGG